MTDLYSQLRHLRLEFTSDHSVSSSAFSIVTCVFPVTGLESGRELARCFPSISAVLVAVLGNYRSIMTKTLDRN